MSKRNASLPWAQACYGIDLQGEKAVIVRGERRHGRATFATVSPRDPLFAEAIRARVPCVACLTARESLTRWLEAPFSSSRKAGRVFPTLLDIQLPFALEDCVYSFLSARGPRHVTRALAVAARLEDVHKKLEALAALGIDPMALDHEGLALWTQSLREAPVEPGEENGLRMIVHLRGEPSTLVVGRGGEFLGAHPVRPGDAGQIRRFLKPHGAPSGRTRWFWVGAGAQDARKVSDLHALLSREWPGPSAVPADPETFLARALAERALLAGPLRCNLRCGSLTHAATMARAKRRWASAAALFLAAGFILCGCGVAASVAARQREAAVDRAFRSLADSLAGFPVNAKGSAAIQKVGDKVHKKMENLKPFLNVFDPSLTVTLAALADSAKRNSLRLDRVSLGRDKVQVTGVARSWTGGDDLLAELQRWGYSAALDRKDAGADGKVPFSITSGGGHEP